MAKKPHIPLFLLVVGFFYRIGLRMRYRITFINKEIFRDYGAKLYLPNHLSLVYPQIMVSFSYRYKPLAGILDEAYYKIGAIRWFLKMLNCVPVPGVRSREAKPMEKINKGLRKAFGLNNDVLLYPSGQLSRDGYERIINKRSAHQICRDLDDDVKIIGVRFSGLWGSMWSRAKNKKTPNFLITYIKGILFLFLNLFLFSPRRKVTVEFVDITKEAKEMAQKDRQSFNTFLEEFYNSNRDEKPTFIRHIFYLPGLK